MNLAEIKKLQGLLSGDAVDYVPLTWYRAEKYDINDDDEIVVKEMGKSPFKPPPYYPLVEAELFPSFTRLGRDDTHLSDKKILNWVGKYGLLKREPYKEDPIRWDKAVQIPMKVTEFVQEAKQARSASLLYYDLNQGQGGIESLKRRLRDVRDNHSKDRPPSELDKELISYWEDELDKPGVDEINRGLITQIIFETVLKEKLSGVNLSLFTPPNEDNPFMYRTAPAYRPRRSWSCSDLISVMYLHFYLWVTGALPMRLCDDPGCRTPFPLTRKDKRYCDDGCRSSGRPSRRK